LNGCMTKELPYKEYIMSLYISKVPVFSIGERRALFNIAYGL